MTSQDAKSRRFKQEAVKAKHCPAQAARVGEAQTQTVTPLMPQDVAQRSLLGVSLEIIFSLSQKFPSLCSFFPPNRWDERSQLLTTYDEILSP